MTITYYIYKLTCDDLKDFVYLNFTKNPSQKKRYYKDNTYLTYKVHKNEILYKTIRENGGWEKWRFIIIDQVKCNKYQIHNICEEYRKQEINSKNNLERSIPNVGSYNNVINSDNKHNKMNDDKLKIVHLDNEEIQETTKKNKKIQKNKNLDTQKNNNNVQETHNNDNLAIPIRENIQESHNNNNNLAIPIRENIQESHNNNLAIPIRENIQENTIIPIDYLQKTNDLPNNEDDHQLVLYECQNNSPKNNIQITTSNIDNDLVISDELYNLDTNNCFENTTNEIVAKNINDNISLSKYHKEIANELLEIRLLNKKKQKGPSLKNLKKHKNISTLKYRKLDI